MKQDSSMEATMARIKAMEQGNSVANSTTTKEAIASHFGIPEVLIDKEIQDLCTPLEGCDPHNIKPHNNNSMVVRIKRTNPKAVLPKYGHIGEDACFDLTAIDASVDEYGNSVYDFGWAFEIPQGYVGLVFPRSSNSKKDMMLTNCVGVIDSGYRGTVTAKFRLVDKNPSSSFNHTNIYQVGERVCQMMIVPVPQIEFEVVDELSDTSRGEGGYGSTGK